MHVVMFGDQHLDSLGGAQVSMRLQRRHLEKAGHHVTVVAPAMHGQRAREAVADPGYVDTPSVPVTADKEYALTWPGRRTDRWIDDAFAERGTVDVVHVQADFWGAYMGHRFARRHRLPVVHTMHNRVDVGVEATAPFPRTVLRMLNAWQRSALDSSVPGEDGWAYLRRLARTSDAVTAPSRHFAARLERHGVVPRTIGRGVDVVWNGIDDDLLDEVMADAAADRADGPPRFVWLGRMSPEKRLMPFLEALAESGVAAHVELIGGGAQLAPARRFVDRYRPRAEVVFAGRLPYAETLRRIAGADAVVQTSIGFETQGMTIFEAASLSTPSVVSDPDLARELETGYWAVGGGVDRPPMAANGSVGALAAALRQAAADIEAGTPVAVNPLVRERFRQSSRTNAMIEIYDQVRAQPSSA